MSVREASKDAKRRKILDSAGRLFANLGFEEATVRAIAKDAGVGLGTVLLYFESKHALLLEVWRERVLAAIPSVPEEASDGSLVDGALRVFSPFLETYAKDLPLARVVVQKLPWLEGRAAELHLPELRAFLGALEELIAENRRRGCIRDDVPSELLSTTLFALYYGACLELTSPLANLPLALVVERLRARLALVEAGFAHPQAFDRPRPSPKRFAPSPPRDQGSRS